MNLVSDNKEYNFSELNEEYSDMDTSIIINPEIPEQTNTNIRKRIREEIMSILQTQIRPKLETLDYENKIEAIIKDINVKIIDRCLGYPFIPFVTIIKKKDMFILKEDNSPGKGNDNVIICSVQDTLSGPTYNLKKVINNKEWKFDLLRMFINIEVNFLANPLVSNITKKQDKNMEDIFKDNLISQKFDKLEPFVLMSKKEKVELLDISLIYGKTHIAELSWDHIQPLKILYPYQEYLKRKGEDGKETKDNDLSKFLIPVLDIDYFTADIIYVLSTSWLSQMTDRKINKRGERLKRALTQNLTLKSFLKQFITNLLGNGLKQLKQLNHYNYKKLVLYLYNLKKNEMDIYFIDNSKLLDPNKIQIYNLINLKETFKEISDANINDSPKEFKLIDIKLNILPTGFPVSATNPRPVRRTIFNNNFSNLIEDTNLVYNIMILRDDMVDSLEDNLNK